jgi:undecaprenyl pyrophosphate phosphatase UppP
VIVGASVLKGARLAMRRERPPGLGPGAAAGAAAAFCSTLVSMRLIAMLERSRSLLPYAGYRAALAAVSLAVLRARSRRAGRLSESPQAPLGGGGVVPPSPRSGSIAA